MAGSVASARASRPPASLASVTRSLEASKLTNENLKSLNRGPDLARAPVYQNPYADEDDDDDDDDDTIAGSSRRKHAAAYVTPPAAPHSQSTHAAAGSTAFGKKPVAAGAFGSSQTAVPLGGAGNARAAQPSSSATSRGAPGIQYTGYDPAGGAHAMRRVPSTTAGSDFGGGSYQVSPTLQHQPRAARATPLHQDARTLERPFANGFLRMVESPQAPRAPLPGCVRRRCRPTSCGPSRRPSSSSRRRLPPARHPALARPVQVPLRCSRPGPKRAALGCRSRAIALVTMTRTRWPRRRPASRCPHRSRGRCSVRRVCDSKRTLRTRTSERWASQRQQLCCHPCLAHKKTVDIWYLAWEKIRGVEGSDYRSTRRSRLLFKNL